MSFIQLLFKNFPLQFKFLIPKSRKLDAFEPKTCCVTALVITEFASESNWIKRPSLGKGDAGHRFTMINYDELIKHYVIR